ncbi:hypothetical protein Cgig2_012911 [Carnegiea gigantea]|uniref:DUF4283 domain-containing protein n=1 Tax=Carnegiea gigantea TaxID=171969 RepID=A0A9Q1JHV9_9CARY|nr:hypothetical protein Cgig2_012911 [Carnegiea gigantea]
MEEGQQREYKMQIEVTAQTPGSYAALVDPEEEAALKFIALKEINEKKCAKIEKNDIQSKVEYCANVVICGLIRSNPPTEIIDGNVHRIWSKFEINIVVLVRKEPVIKYWGLDSLSKLGSMLGVLIKTDRVTKEKTALSYAHMLIEMKLNETFPEYSDFINDWDVVMRQSVKYEWKPIKCDYYQMLGHEDTKCGRKNKIRKELRVVIRGQRIESNTEERTHPDEDQGHRMVL